MTISCTKKLSSEKEKNRKITEELTNEYRTHAKALKEINDKLQEQKELYKQVTAEFVAGQQTFATISGNLKLLTLENQIKSLSDAYADFCLKDGGDGNGTLLTKATSLHMKRLKENNRNCH